ncbi:SpoIID/LytB domain-containing protein [Bacillus sp. V3B]|uniref:SpoIID/LytB domain-containing protein n=1 Tax=Bacillus sp. V3B TaxID=2804915 RepID=UPI002108E634|nr:SpoIID/LytB domain-containing protein [Bacillus sp. V3B]MCQ6276859.1 SpoIID/LytB domain-containing protein [Bacillus sp. V3B]
MKKFIPILVAFNFLVALCFSGGNISASSSTSSQINVKLSAYLGNQSSVNISITGNYQVVGDASALSGAYVIKVESGQLVLYKNGTKVKNYGGSLTVNPQVYNTQNMISINGRKYLGTMRFEVESGKYVRPYNTLPVEDYLKGVVSQEMSPSWGSIGGMDALKAQAIAARTYAQGVSPIDDGQTDQVYTGYYWYENTNQAIEATQGLVLKYNGQVIGANALYSSSNGGKTLSKVNSWGDASWNHIPYLQVKEDPYDTRSSSLGNKNVDWNFSLTKNQIGLTGLDLSQPALWWNEKKEISADASILTNIKNWLHANGHIDKKYEIKIVSVPAFSFDLHVPANQTINGQMTLNYLLRDTTTNQYAMENGQIKTFSKTIHTRAYTFRSMINSSIMKSPYIKSVQDDGTKITINGGGWGHGIGMSQYGAFQMSKEGKTYREILNFYYPGTSIEDVLGPTVSNLQTTVNDDQVVTFSYYLDEESTTTVTLNSPQKNILSSKVQAKGNTQFTWDASSLPSGNYSFTLVTKDKGGNSSQVAGSFTITKKAEEPEVIEENEGKDVSPPEDTEEQEPTKLTLTAPVTYLYSGPNGVGKTGHTLSPQTVSVLSRQGDWYEIKTWVGPKWIEVKTESILEENNESSEVPMKLTLLNRTNLYSSANTAYYIGSSLSPQTVTAVETKGEWFKIKTWLGEKWIKPERYSMAVAKKITVTSRMNLYNNPSTEKAVNSIAPQTVNVIAEIPNTGWYQIKTWIGPKWIKQDVPKQPVNQSITLKTRTDLYHNPDLGDKPFSSLSPQTVKTINKLGNTGWYEIKTWVGPKWISLN